VPRELQIGTTLGRFRLDEILGQGGMGVVYLAHDSLLDSPLALKVLRTQGASRDEIERFKRELLVARRLSHPGICRLFDIHEEGEHLFITMEYVEGPTLHGLIQQRSGLELNRAVDLTRQLCEAMAVAHEAQVIHRDLKPGNIVVRAGDRACILDFGLAKALDLASLTQARMRVGTVAYMAPEVLSAQPATLASDIYSVGVMLYECATGRLPYEGSDVIGLGKAIKRGLAMPPSDYNPEIGPILERAILRSIAVEPHRRYPDFLAFARALEGAGRERIATPPSIPRAEPDGAPPTEAALRPWHRDVERSVVEVLEDPTVAALERRRIRVAVILFSDIVGITQFFDQRGDLAGVRKIRAHNRLLLPVVESHGGTVVKTMGDAIMAVFDSADDGADAAVGMQRALAEHNRAAEHEDDRIHIRIGLHRGPSIFEDRDVFGDAVNVAARICSQAESDQVLVSSTVRESLAGRIHSITHFHSKVELKGKREAFDLHWLDWALGTEAGQDQATREWETVAPPSLPVQARVSGVGPTLIGQPARSLPPETAREPPADGEDAGDRPGLPEDDLATRRRGTPLGIDPVRLVLAALLILGVLGAAVLVWALLASPRPAPVGGGEPVSAPPEVSPPEVSPPEVPPPEVPPPEVPPPELQTADQVAPAAPASEPDAGLEARRAELGRALLQLEKRARKAPKGKLRKETLRQIALGRAALELDDPDQAEKHLDAARQAFSRTKARRKTRR
jgi:class 3 adenylate cyclase/predicted Ser/Thr protein kinase